MAIVTYKFNPGDKLSPEQLKEIEELEKMPDHEIDCSDIPEMTKEDFDHSVRARDVYNGNFLMRNGQPASRKLLENVLRIGIGVGHITESEYAELYAKLPK